jgi:hypothetical protein
MAGLRVLGGAFNPPDLGDAAWQWAIPRDPGSSS